MYHPNPRSAANRHCGLSLTNMHAVRYIDEKTYQSSEILPKNSAPETIVTKWEIIPQRARPYQECRG
jgi:hypothetical protein